MPVINPKHLGRTPLKPRWGPGAIYPINNFYRWLPAVGLFTVASVYNTIVPEYERLWWRLEKNAFTYEHPLEIQQRLAEEQAKEQAKADEDDE